MRWLLLVCLGCWPGQAAPLTAVRPTVHGPVRGGREGEVWSFKGVRYAAPPVGDLRWRAPQPPAPWTAPADATAYGPACPQPAGSLAPLGARLDEDCLFLNVWSAATDDAERRPVMVWFHGGGLTQGAGSSPTYDGSSLAERGVVLVTVNYRLGALGFLVHPALTAASRDGYVANYGLLDQIAALRWVRDNIASFGGEPGNVTIFGQSAGSVSVACLMTSPAAAGLFHRAIAMSGAAPDRVARLHESQRGRPAADERGEAVARKLGVGDASGLRQASWQAVLEASDPGRGLPGDGLNWLAIDGRVLTDSPADVFTAGRQAKVPLLVGATADEGTLWQSKGAALTLPAFRMTARALFGRQVDEAMDYYGVTTDADVPAAFTRVMGDTFVQGAYRIANAHAAAGQPTWHYQVDWVPAKAKASGLGCFHGVELSTLFNTHVRFRDEGESEAQRVAMMQGYWVQFARAGDPNAAGLPRWSLHEAGRNRVMRLADEPEMADNPRARACELLAER